jgi:type I restriction enzyme S subunit
MYKEQTYKTIKECCLLVTDGAHKSPKTIDEGFPYVTVRDIGEDGSIDTNDCKKISLIDFKLLASGNCQPLDGDILFSKDGTVGKVALVQNEKEFVVLSSLAILRPNKGLIDSTFFKYIMLSPNIQDEAIGLKTGAAIKRIVLKTIKEIKIPIPSLPEQQRIVAKLEALFAKIDQAIGLLEENIAHTQALMGSVLDEEFGRLEETSKVVSISEIADVKGGKRLPKGQKLLEFKTDYPYIRVTDFSENGTIEIDKLKFISKEIHEQISRYIITNDDLYISIAGTIGKTGIIPKQLNGANLTENAARLVYKDKSTIDNAFVYYYTKSDKFKRFVEDSTKQVAQPKLALTRLKQIKLALPSLKKQQKVVEKFKHAEERLIALEETQTEKLNHLKALKSSLLDQAFKGEL